VIDCSVGTPCDPPPRGALVALATSGTERGYPASIGNPRYRAAAAAWMGRRFGVEISPAQVAACVGTKELVASVPWQLRLRSPERDVVAHPGVAYPTYAMGAQLAGCRSLALPAAPDGGVELAALEEVDPDRVLALWVNSPGNPTGGLSDLEAAAGWGRRHGVPVLSDECYAELTWQRAPETILSHGETGVLAVHSLSKRSNLAGARAGFYAGDPELVGYLGEIRKHAGLMVPGPVQAAAVAAFEDDDHALRQRERYRRRLEDLTAALVAAGLPCALPSGGFYLWLAVPAWLGGDGGVDADEAVAGGEETGDVGDGPAPSPAWRLAALLAESVGMLVSPGDFYGPGGRGHVRVAVVQPDERIRDCCRRLGSVDLRAAAGAA
jgi:aspartate/methionine/tyrosine aminotransferase